MPRKARKKAASGVYHVMVRGIDKMQLFLDDADNVQYLCYLNFCQNDNFEIMAYCLMGNHVHLLVHTQKQNAEAMEIAMRSIGIRYAAYYNRKYNRVGPVFQGRFASQTVESAGYFLRVLRYIHNNPLAAGIVSDLQDYAWSSYADYFTPRSGCLCMVHTGYAFRLRTQEWLLDWHSQKENNHLAFLDVDNSKKHLSDEEVKKLIFQLVDCQPCELRLMPDEKQASVFAALYYEESARIAQLSRLTGIPKGIIRKLL